MAALETEVYTVTTHSFFESLRPLVRHDVEPIVSRVINDVPKLDMTLGIRFGSEGAHRMEKNVPIGYSTDPLISEKACLMMYSARKRGGESEKAEMQVSIRRPSRDVIDANGIPTMELKRGEVVYFHRSDLQLMRLPDGENVFVFPEATFENDPLRFDFSFTMQQ